MSYFKMSIAQQRIPKIEAWFRDFRWHALAWSERKEAKFLLLLLKQAECKVRHPGSNKIVNFGRRGVNLNKGRGSDLVREKLLAKVSDALMRAPASLNTAFFTA